MKDTRLLWGMPITVAVEGARGLRDAIDRVYKYFEYIDETFSTYKPESEISRINRGEIKKSEWSDDMKTVFRLCDETKRETNGYFDIVARDGSYDPLGLVKGWAVWNGTKILLDLGYTDYFIEAGGDVQVSGKNEGKTWTVGIKNPFNQKEIVKKLFIENEGVATSGTYIRGQHIRNPFAGGESITDILSLTVIGPNVYEADRFATAAFAMGENGIVFIERLRGFEGYMINKDGVGTMTSGFEKFTTPR